MHKHTAASAAGLSALVLFLCLAVAGPAAAQTRDSIRPPASSDGAINTSRSNIKSTARTTGRFVPLVLDLRGQDRSGAPVSLTATINESGEFSFGTPAAGEYVLTVRSREAGEAASAADVAVTLQGIAGGPVETVLVPAAAETGDARLQGQLNSLDVASLSGRRPGKSKYKNIVLRADGRTEVRGTALDMESSAAPSP